MSFELDKEEYEEIEKKHKCNRLKMQINDIDSKINEIEKEKEKLLRNMGGYSEYFKYKGKDYPKQQYSLGQASGIIQISRAKITLANHITKHSEELERLYKDKKNIEKEKCD